MNAERLVVPTIDDTYLADIADLWCRGWSLIPVEFGGKRPLIPWAEFQYRAADFDELERWFGHKRVNIGIVTGTVSRIFVLDCDSAEAQAWAAEHMPPCDLRVRTPRGCHLYYPYSAERPIRNKVRTRYNGGQLELDIRADGGYVVGPGSVHSTGRLYVREGIGWRLCDERR